MKNEWGNQLLLWRRINEENEVLKGLHEEVGNKSNEFRFKKKTSEIIHASRMWKTSTNLEIIFL